MFKILKSEFNRLKALGSSKAEVQALIRGESFKGFNAPTFRHLSTEGFKCSELVYFILNDIARSGAGVSLDIDDQPDWVQEIMAKPEKKKEIGRDESLQVIPGKLYKTWMYEQLIYKQLSGSAYAEGSTFGTRVTDMPIIRPDMISPIEGNSESLQGWRVTRHGMMKNFKIQDIFWSKNLDPLRFNHGWAALASSNKSLAQRTEIARLNMQVLKNDGAVKGFMKLIKSEAPGAKSPDKEEMLRIKKAVNEKFGADAEGEFAVVNGNMDWITTGMTGKEMDWSKTKEQNAREIAIGNGYPPYLLGFSSGSTFANVSEARQFLWNHTIIPWVEGILCDLSLFFQAVSGDDSIFLKINKKEILSIQEQLSKMRESDGKDYDRGLITREEWRERNDLEREGDGEFKLDFNTLSLPLDED